MRKLVIDRTEWYRGQSGVNSRLLIPEDGYDPGKRCCLGIYGKAIGVPDHLLKDQTCFANFDRYEYIPEEARWLVELKISAASDPMRNSGAAQELMSTNDQTEITEWSRELRIAEEFKKHGVEVTFIN